jgi:amino acid permease
MRVYIAIGCAYIIVGCVIAVLLFYESYCARSRSQKDFKFRPVAVKSVKFAGAIFLLLVVFTASQMLCRHFHIGFWISFMISVLISLGFLRACYLFKIKNPAFSNDSTKKVKKKNEAMDDLQKKLSNSDFSDKQ